MATQAETRFYQVTPTKDMRASWGLEQELSRDGRFNFNDQEFWKIMQEGQQAFRESLVQKTGWSAPRKQTAYQVFVSTVYDYHRFLQEASGTMPAAWVNPFTMIENAKTARELDQEFSDSLKVIGYNHPDPHVRRTFTRYQPLSDATYERYSKWKVITEHPIEQGHRSELEAIITSYAALHDNNYQEIHPMPSEPVRV